MFPLRCLVASAALHSLLHHVVALIPLQCLAPGLTPVCSRGNQFLLCTRLAASCSQLGSRASSEGQCSRGVAVGCVMSTARAGTGEGGKRDSGRSLEGYQGTSYKVYVSRGMERFKAGQVEPSIADFDRAIQLQPGLEPYMWQRGLSLYYGTSYEVHSNKCG
ncbi:unnamed protein product [Discosporangium mesarthrocarpum]